MKLWKGMFIMGLLGILSGCFGSKPVDHYAAQEPKLDLQTYFSGPIKAWGVVQDFTGKVTRRFDVDMVGTWTNGVGTLEEKFIFDDGEVQERTWTITKVGENQYTGTAGDILGQATGQAAGNAMRWAYKMDLNVGNSTYRITFDDWMFLMNDDILINRSYLKKFGITVGELSIFMQKQK
jgi:hypothetical protein